MNETDAGVQQEHSGTKRKRSRYEIVLMSLTIVCVAAFAVCLVLQYTQGPTASSPQRLGLKSITSGLAAVLFIVLGLDNARRERMYPAALGFTIAGFWIILTVVELSPLITSS